ncbi:Polysaccharide deacetylase [Halomicrobium zhouii]|uniref:Polysaccharide deacetylase n=1 Tax=Halomicrobium zhouii TaxID=767519 RepID=A0A1I6LIH5_9EURY|nr:polysaccharide deacetylase family protein [Halomicrobium zhouii]SFS03254.1 Polysaccharide deacetylase [Halomicrobium zhouii]
MTTSYLTVDDAPTETLPEKLAILEDHDVPALFFCEGRRLAEYPDHARQAVEAGYHIGNHAYSHQHASELSVDDVREEVAKTEALVEDVYADAGVTRPARLFRFPYGDKGGERADRFQEVLEAEEFTPPDPSRIEYDWDDENRDGDRDWYWTVSVEDWEADSRAELRDHVAAVDDRFDQPGDDVVLFHDGGNTPALFEAFLELLAERDVEFGDPLDLVN